MESNQSKAKFMMNMANAVGSQISAISRSSSQAFSDRDKGVFVEAISIMLALQLVLTQDEARTLVLKNGKLNSHALGYIYGFVDSALTSIGQNMMDMSIGPPILYGIVRAVFPGEEERALQYLLDNINSDGNVILGVMRGGQQYLDALNGKHMTPMDLGLYIAEPK